MDDLRDEIRGARRRLERETVTAPTLDEVLAAADEQLARLPPADRSRSWPARAPIAWRVGARARSRTAGWEGRIVALDRGGKRATLEVGGMRVTVDDRRPRRPPAGEDRRPARPVRSRGRGAAPRRIDRALRFDRARTIASSLDLRGARVEEALELARALPRRRVARRAARARRSSTASGLGRCEMPCGASCRTHPLVRSWRPGGRGEGGDGATVVEL